MKGLVVSMASHAHSPRDAAAPPMPAATLVAQQLELILASRHLDGSERLKRFLRLIVEETLAGRGSALKEYTIGVLVYDRGEAFDPKGDSIVRGEANRLRGRLADYYADPATHDEVRIDLPKGSYVPIFSQPPAAHAAGAPRRWYSWAALVVVLASAIMGGILAGLRMRAVPFSSDAVVRAELGIEPAAEEVNSGSARESGEAWMPTRGGSRTALAWTPDGRGLVFVGRRNGVQQLSLRQLDVGDAHVLPNTEGAQVSAVTPDGRAVVFWAGNDIKRVPLEGGPAQTIAQGVEVPAGLTVGESGVVFFDYGCGIWQSTGERAVAVTAPAGGETCHVLPQLLAHDRVLIYTARHSVWMWGEEAIVAHVLATGVRKVLLRDAADARYIPPGYLIFMRRGLLMAVPFNLDRLEVQGEPVGLVDAVAQALTSDHGSNVTGAGQFSVSGAGTLAYIPSPVVPLPEAALVSVDRRGRRSELPLEVRNYFELRLSPDGRFLSVEIASLTEQVPWIADLTRGTVTKLTSGGETGWPRWTPDGERIAFLLVKNGVSQLVWQRVDGSAAPEPLASGLVFPSSWSPDGQHLAVVKDGDIWVVTLRGGQPTLSRLAETLENEMSPEFSPDGKWLAYLSDRTGRLEVYVRPYPGPGPSTPVSVTGAGMAAWNPQGGELFFLGPVDAVGRAQMMAVTIEAGQPATPRALFVLDGDLAWGCVPVRCYDVAKDGQRFFVTKLLRRGTPPPVTHINLVLNWVEELKAKVPASRGR